MTEAPCSKSCRVTPVLCARKILFAKKIKKLVKWAWSTCCAVYGSAVQHTHRSQLNRVDRVSHWAGTPQWRVWFSSCSECFCVSVLVLEFESLSYRRLETGENGPRFSLPVPENSFWLGTAIYWHFACVRLGVPAVIRQDGGSHPAWFSRHRWGWVVLSEVLHHQSMARCVIACN